MAAEKKAEAKTWDTGKIFADGRLGHTDPGYNRIGKKGSFINAECAKTSFAVLRSYFDYHDSAYRDEMNQMLGLTNMEMRLWDCALNFATFVWRDFHRPPRNTSIGNDLREDAENLVNYLKKMLVRGFVNYEVSDFTYCGIRQHSDAADVRLPLDRLADLLGEFPGAFEGNWAHVKPKKRAHPSPWASS